MPQRSVVAPDEAVLKELSDRAGLPTNRVCEITTVIEPKTGR